MRCKPANPVLARREGAPTFWAGWRGPTFGPDGAAGQDVRDITRHCPAGTRPSGCTWGAGPWGTCLVLDGSGPVAQTFPALANSPFTIALRFSLSSTPSFAGLIAIGSVGSDNHCAHIFAASDTAIKFGLYNDDLTVTCPSLGLGVWHEVVATLDVALLQSVYLDGVLLGTRTAGAGFLGDTAGWIGSFQGAAFRMSGRVDLARVYPRAIPAAEVARDFASPYWRLRRPRHPVGRVSSPPPSACPSLLLAC